METLVAKLLDIAKQHPAGFTVDLNTLNHVSSGWVVAKKETQNSFGVDGLKKVLAVALKTNKVVGGWKEGKLFYFDAVEIYEDEETATAAGIANDQIAIYHLQTATVKFLK